MSLIEELQFQAFGQFLGIERAGSNGEDASSGIVSPELADALAAAYQFAGYVQRASFCIMSLESYSSFQITYHIAPLWVEVDEQTILDGGGNSSRCFR